jgi:CHASE2 domain-containing sensor protein
MLVGLDDESIERLGRWPWSRSVHAALIERLQGRCPRDCL